MRVFHCERCGNIVPFAAQRCAACEAPLGYLSEERTIRVLSPADGQAVYRAADHDDLLWRCLNAAWGCNWMLAADTDGVWCRSCRLTRGRPDEGRPEAINAWMEAEAVKRRLVHQLDVLALPIEDRTAAGAGGLAFDLVHIPGEGGLTGHLGGVVTLDLAETDERHRDELRHQLDEPFRTVIGHLRHEIGHHYWDRLVGQSDHLAAFRRLFGDERVDYADAIAGHYAGAGEGWDTDRYVTAYAASHPLEDWAETFAHYLHILDATDTAVAHDWVPVAANRHVHVLDIATVATLDITDVLELWRPVSATVNDIAESLGAPPVYPFELTGIVVDKLAFVHQQVVAHTERDRFYGNN